MLNCSMSEGFSRFSTITLYSTQAVQQDHMQQLQDVSYFTSGIKKEFSMSRRLSLNPARSSKPGPEEDMFRDPDETGYKKVPPFHKFVSC